MVLMENEMMCMKQDVHLTHTIKFVTLVHSLYRYNINVNICKSHFNAENVV